eukprot:Amastigsp_a12178_22.p2 type:complete len:138 gc:universal Amastigsp_a12178_22:131-544(+)
MDMPTLLCALRQVLDAPLAADDWAIDVESSTLHAVRTCDDDLSGALSGLERAERFESTLHSQLQAEIEFFERVLAARKEFMVSNETELQSVRQRYSPLLELPTHTVAELMVGAVEAARDRTGSPHSDDESVDAAQAN